MGSLLWSCSDKDQETSVFPSYTLDLEDNPDKHLFDYVKNVEVTLLEETDSSLFGSIAKVIYDQNFIYVLEGKGKTLYKFTSSGKYVQHLNNVGKGPDQYKVIDDFHIDAGEIVLLDGQNRKLIFLSKVFDFLRQQSSDFHAYKFKVLDNGYVFDNNYYPVQDTIYASLVITNNQLDIQEVLLPFENERQYSLANNSIQSMNGGYYYRKTYSDTVFYIDEKTDIAPTFRLDFGENWKFGQLKSDMAVYNVMSRKTPIEGEMVSWLDVWTNDDFVFLRTVLFPSYNTLGTIIDRSKAKALNVKLQTDDDPRSAVNLRSLDSNGRFLTGLTIDQFEYLLKFVPLSDIATSSGEKLSELPNNENAMILTFELGQLN